MDMYELFDRMLHQEFTFCRIYDLENDRELCRGFADDLLTGSKSVLQKYNVITWGLATEDEIFINVRKKEKCE